MLNVPVTGTKEGFFITVLWDKIPTVYVYLLHTCGLRFAYMFLLLDIV